MNALRVNFVTHDFAAALRFYSAMFARPPAMLKANSAEWVLSEPRLRFAISAAGAPRYETAPECGWLRPSEKRAPPSPALGAGR